MNRPVKFPEYATIDVVDPISGVNNVVEPDAAKKELGWGPEGEFPPRQFFNWLHRLTNEWIQYLDGNKVGLEVVELTGTTSGGDCSYNPFPIGFTSTNTYVLSAKVCIELTPPLVWDCIAVDLAGGTLATLVHDNTLYGVILKYPNNVRYHYKPYKILICRR